LQEKKQSGRDSSKKGASVQKKNYLPREREITRKGKGMLGDTQDEFIPKNAPKRQKSWKRKKKTRAPSIQAPGQTEKRTPPPTGGKTSLCLEKKKKKGGAPKRGVEQ